MEYVKMALVYAKVINGVESSAKREFVLILVQEMVIVKKMENAHARLDSQVKIVQLSFVQIAVTIKENAKKVNVNVMKVLQE
jgi:type VI protein secretion system component Hcp